MRDENESKANERSVKKKVNSQSGTVKNSRDVKIDKDKKIGYKNAKSTNFEKSSVRQPKTK